MQNREDKKERIIECFILSVLLIASFFLWNTYILYPIKLFVVLFHESSHALAAILSGGKVTVMNIGFNLSGKCETEGGNNILIASAGYLGSLIFGLIFFIAPVNSRIGKWVIICISGLTLVLTLSVATGGIFMLTSLLLCVFLIITSLYMRFPIVSILVRAFGLISCLYVLIDIKEEILAGSLALSDAGIISKIIGIPSIAIGIAWIAISLFLLYFSMIFIYSKKLL